MSDRPTATNEVAAKHWTLTIETVASATNGQTTDASSSAVVPGCLPRVEPELVRSSQSDSPQVTAPALPQVDAERIRSTRDDSVTPTTDSRHTVESEVIQDLNGHPDGVAIEASSPVERETVSTSNRELTAVMGDSLPLTKPENAGSSNAAPAAVTADSLVTEPPIRLAIAPVSGQQIAAPTTEWTTKKNLEPFRDFESANGYRHLTLLANEEARLVFQTAPNGLAAEQFRLLRRTLTREFEGGAVLLITSPAMGDGKTLTSVNLASCLAESGQPTLLVEADIRRPTIRQILSAEVEPPGVEDVLARNVEPRRAVYGIKELNLYAAMVTRIPDYPAQLIGGPGVKHLLAWARENFLWVVLDAPPTLPAADVSELLPFADAAVLVIRAQSTPRELAKQAVEILGKHLRGVIFNEVTVDSNPHYRYLNNYYDPQKSNSKSRGSHLVKRTKSM
ncbi:MAG: CpsD/CapB family tyrosine-protein kinase [Candidatus Acidiferrum sp.]